MSLTLFMRSFIKGRNEGLKGKILSFIQALPVTLPVGLAAFSVVAMLLLVAGKFYTWPVLILGLAAAYFAMRQVYKPALKVKRPGSGREQIALDVLVVVGIVLWTLCNLPFTAQRIYTDRDPATYGVTAAWLVNHPDLHIPKLAAFSNLPEIAPGSGGGFGPSLKNPNEVFAQGAHLLPALLGLGGRLLGYNTMFRLNVLIGAVALLAIYGFARLITKPRWAAMVVLALAVSLPMFYFSRNTYTEPLTAVFVFSSLALLWYAQHVKTYTLWLLAGTSLGAGILARIDAYLPIAAIEVFLIFWLISARKSERTRRLSQAALLAVTTVIMGVLSWLDLSLYSSGYFLSLRAQYRSELALVVLILAIGAVTVTLAWKTEIISRLYESTKSWLGTVTKWSVLTFFVFFALYPLRYANVILKHGATFTPPPGQTYAFANYQALAFYWSLWYLPVITILAVSALAWLWQRLLGGKDIYLLPFILVLSLE